MKIFRRKKDKKLYLVYYVSPMKYTGRWYEAVPYLWNGKIVTRINNFEKEFVLVAKR